MKVFRVLQVSVIKISESPLKLSIQAQGMTATSGWTNPRLDNSVDPNPDDAVLEFSFDADKPTDISLPQLTPIMATVDFSPTNGADAVIVSSRIDSITVHASEFVTPGQEGPTTYALGEEGPPQATTLAYGEEEGPSTRAVGEETAPPNSYGKEPTTLALGEEGPPQATTLAYGEEEGPTTRAVGEEGPTTYALGEESSPFGRY